jgi:hypothetical protein
MMPLAIPHKQAANAPINSTARAPRENASLAQARGVPSNSKLAPALILKVIEALKQK